MASFNLSDLTAWWFGSQTWVNTATRQYGQPVLGDTATIGTNGNPWIYNGTLNGPSVFIRDPSASAATGLSAYNSTIGTSTAIYVQSGSPTVKLSNTVVDGNVFAQGGSTTLTVPTGAYGDNLGTMIVGGISTSVGNYTPASLTVSGGGTFVNFSNMYAFNSGTLALTPGQPTLLNDGLIVANAGTVSMSGTLGNPGSLLAIHNGTVALTNMALSGTASIYDHGAFLLAGSITGSGVLDLNNGRIEFTNPGSEDVAQMITTELSGSSFTLQFDGATSVSDLLLLPSGSGGHDDLIVAASFSTGIQLMAFSLDTAHSYAGSQFSTQGNQVTYTASTS